jgi:hypothetical protein
MLETILVTTVFNNIPFFDPIAIDIDTAPSRQKKNKQKKMNHSRMEQVNKLSLDDSPRRLHTKTTGLFDAMWCFSYAKEQVSSETIELAFDSSEQPRTIQRAFAWTEDIDESTAELAFDSGEQPSVIQLACAIDESTADEVECCMSDDEEEAFETDSLVSYQYQTKSVSGTVSTATTVTMNTFNTIESWETLNTNPTSVSDDPAMDEENSPPPLTIADEEKSPPPLTIAVLSFKPKQRKDAVKFPSLPSKRSMRHMHSLSVANYAY